MRDLSEVLAAQAGRQQPSGRPEFADLLARRHRRQWHRRVACAATLGCAAAAVAALAVAGGLSPAPAPRGNVLLSGTGVASPAPEVMLTRDYAVTPTGPPPASEAAALPWRCSSLPGVRAGGVLLSDPPHYLFKVHGTAAQVARFEQCLAALPDTRVELQTPGPSVPPATPPTTQ